MVCGRGRQPCWGAARTLVALAAALAAHAPSAAAAEADLVIESVTHTPAVPARGETVTFTVMVRNQGDANSRYFYVAFHLDSATEPTANNPGDARVAIDDLPAGAAKAIEFEFDPPLDAGAFTAWAYADCYDYVVESDENNNAGPAGGYGWSVAASPEPDLFIESMTCSPSVAAPGETVTFTVTVTSDGGSDAGAFSVGFWSDLSAPPDIDDVPEDSLDVADLAVGASIPLEFSLTAPGTGQYRAYAYVDRRGGGEVTEFVETNNTAYDYWSVFAPDAYEDDDDFASANPISDGDFQVHSIHVGGDEDWLAFDAATVGGAAVTLSNAGPFLDVILYDDALAVIGWSNDGEILWSSELQPGTYYVKIQSDFSGWLVSEYTVDFVLTEGDAYEPDNSFAQANIITLGEPQNHSIHSLDDADYVRFTLSQTADVVVVADGAGDDILPRLYDSTQTFITIGSRMGGTVRIESAGLPAGTYYVRVASGMSQTAPLDYTLTVTSSAPEKPDLVIEAFTCDPSQAAPGQAITFTATVRNTGGVGAGAFNVGFWSDESDSAPDLITTPELDADVWGLAAGASVDLAFEVTVPALGDCRAYVFADRRGGTSEIDEFSEQNNRGVLYWTSIAADDYEDDDSFAQAKTILVGEVQTHSIHVVGDQDHLTFTLSAAGFVVLSIDDGLAYACPYLYDGSETLLASGSNARQPGLLQAGTYYVMVEEYNNNGMLARYDIGLAVGGDAYEPDNCFAEATPIMTGNPQTHSISPTVDFDFVKFTLTEPSDVSIEATEQFRDVTLHLYDPSLMEVAYEKYAGIVRPRGLPAGTYYVMARGYNLYDPLDSYVLNLTVSSPPKPDLAFESTGISPRYPGPGDTVTLTATVANLGSVDAGPFSVGFWSDWPEGTSPGITDTPEQETALSGLVAGETAEIAFTMTAPAWGSPRSYVYVDCGGRASEVSEFDEDNNRRYVGYDVYAPDAYESDDVFADAKPIAVGEVQTHSLHIPSDADYVKFTLGETSDVSIYVDLDIHQIPMYEIRACLFNASEDVLGSNDEITWMMWFSYNSPAIVAHDLAAGTYYVMVDCVTGHYPVAKYELSLAVLTPDAYEADNSFAEASAISAGEMQSRSLHVTEDKDYVKFVLSQTSDVAVSVHGDGLSRILYGPGGTQLDWPDSPIALATGTYYVFVEPGRYSVVVPAYTLTLEVAAHPQPPSDGCWADGQGTGAGGAACWFACFALPFFIASRRKARALRA